MDKKLENKLMRVKVNFEGDEVLKNLCQHKKQWHGITVFTFSFNGVDIDFVTLKDAKMVKKKCIEVVLNTKNEKSKVLNPDADICPECGKRALRDYCYICGWKPEKSKGKDATK